MRARTLPALLLMVSTPVIAPAQEIAPVSANAQVVDISKFRQTHPTLNFLLTPLPDMTAGQIPDYGGPIQNYLNYSASFPMIGVITPFGGNGVATFAHGRGEIFGNIAGIYVPLQSSWTRPNAWFTQATFGVRYALDPGRHLWVGATGRYTADFADKTRQHGLWSADLTYRH
jgi:hypothetical protein